MKDISYHILDIAQNSIHARAKNITISIAEDDMKGTLELIISDNGCGMPAEMLQQVVDPFFTTSVKKKVGLGLPLLKQNAELTEGHFQLESFPNKGTIVKAVFHKNHIDMIPTGDIALTMRILISSDPATDFIYRHSLGNKKFELDTAEMRKELEGIPLNNPDVLKYISGYIHKNLDALTIENELTDNE
jgi:hypothetical protein